MPFPGLNRAQVQTLIDASVSAYYTISEIDTLLSGKSSTGHTHDDRYYTETEIDALLSGFGGDHNHDDRYYTQAEVDTLLLGKASTSHTHDYSSVYAALVHNHDDRYYTDSEVDAAFAALSGVYAPSSHNHSASAITSGTLDASRLPDLSAVYSVVGHNHDLVYAALSHDHDSRYFTESEVTALLAGKSDTTHNHDLAYATLSHTHDDRYYTESEVDTLLSGKASSTHSHAASDIDSGILANARVNWAAPDALGSGTPAAAAFTNLSADALTIGGAGGAGFAQLANQASAPATPTSSLRVYADGSNRLAWKHTSGFAAIIDTSGFTADRVLTIPNATGTLVTQAATQTLTNKTLTSPVISGGSINSAPIGATTPAAGSFTTLGGSVTDTAATAVTDVLDVSHAVSSGTPTTAFGVGMKFRGHSATVANGLRDMGRLRYDWGVNAADASRKSRAVISVVESGTERDQLIVTGTYTRFNHNGQSPVAYFQFEEGAADGRQRLIHFSDSASANIIQARGGVKTVLLGPASNAIYSVSSYGMTGNIYLSDIATVVPAPIFGVLPMNTGTHKSLYISTPETQPSVAGSFTKTDIVDLVAFSNVSNTWGGTRPSIRHTALEHLFRTDSGTGQNNPGTDIFRVQSTGVRVESTLAFHLGDPAVDGTWRITRSSNDLVVDRRESSAWVTKQTILSTAPIVPPGVIAPYAGATAPAGWLLCYGQAVSRATYAALFAALSTTYGAGDGSTTFNVPDLRGRSPLGLDNMGGSSANRVTATAADSLGGSGGAETHTLTTTEMPSHRHTLNSNSSGAVGNRLDFGNGLAAGATHFGYIDADVAARQYLSNTGGDGAHNNMQPYLALSYIIKT